MLRDYQQDAVNIAFDYVKNSVIKIVIEMATGAGKSLVIAELARLIYEYTGQRTIVTAPKGELVKQNAAKFRALGLECSIFSAKAGKKCLKHPVVFCSPGTLANALDKFEEPVAAIIMDEGDGITDQIKRIIKHFRGWNADLREIALTATPYRTNEGWIFKQFEDGRPSGNPRAYFDKRVYRIGTRELIERRFLVDIVTTPVPIEYDTSQLVRDRRGKFTPASIEKTFIGKGRRTSQIVATFVERQRFYRACMVFCASRAHAAEVMASLPPGTFRYIDGETPDKERNDIIARYKHGLITYLVNVDVLTVGTDLPIADHLAILRHTDSDRLLQQIIGRGLRLHPDKEHCLISDFAGNLQPFVESGRDIFSPEIKTREKKEAVILTVPCPKCAHLNEFAARPNPERNQINDSGYFVDLAGDVMELDVYQGEHKPKLKVPFAAHYGRRCNGYRQRGNRGHLIRCSHTWLDKKCPKCQASNDIAARQCIQCKHELADPNRYLEKYASEVVTTPDGWRMGKPKKCGLMEYTANSGHRMILLSIMVQGRKTAIPVYLNPFGSSASGIALWEYVLLNGFGDSKITAREALDRRRRFVMPTAIKWKQKGNGHPEVLLIWGNPK